MQKKLQVMYLWDNLDDISTELLESKTYSNDYCFVLHCWQGQMQVEVNGLHYTLGKDQLLVCLPHFLLGIYQLSEECRYNILSMPFDRFAQLVERTFHTEPGWWEKYTLLQQMPIVSLTAQQETLLDPYFRLIKAYLQAEQTPFRERMTEKLAEIIYYEISASFDGVVSDKEEHISQPDRLFRRFIGMLHVDYITHRDVAWYAEQLCVSPKYLSAVCVEKSGRTASDWIKKSSIEQIRKKLTETDIPVKDLAFRFQFPSQSFFGKYVKRLLGMSPQAYRRQNTNI